MQTNFFKNADARAALLGELQTNYADKVCLRAESSKAFCKVVCSGNADKLCLKLTSWSVFSDSIINFSDGPRCISQRARVQPPVRVELLLGSN